MEPWLDQWARAVAGGLSRRELLRRAGAGLAGAAIAALLPREAAAARAGRQLDCCGGSCVGTPTDARNCGACGQACPAGATCCHGSCVSCPAGQAVNPLTCGCCTVASDQHPEPNCTADTECCSGACVSSI